MHSSNLFSRWQQVFGFALWLSLAFAAAALGAMASVQAGEFYASLVRPGWAPPGWLFGPVWTTLFFMMAVSAWLVWRARGFMGAWGALMLFVTQLAANSLWSWLFFVWHEGALAFAEVVLLWVMIAATIFLFWRVSKLAAALLMPYLAWVSFAALLNFSVWQLNPAVLG